MATVGQIQSHQAVMGAHQSLVDLQVGRATAQALDVNSPLLRVQVEGLEGTGLAGELNGVDVLVASVVTSSGVSLGVLVGHGRTESIEDSTRGEVLGGNQDDGLALALDLFFLRGESASATPLFRRTL